MELTQEDKDLLDPQGAKIRQATEEATLISTQLTDLNPHVEMKMKEFGEHVRSGGWRLGFLVASSVFSDENGGNRGNQYTGGMENIFHGKISCRAFAKGSGISHPTVSKYLKTWDMASADGLIPSSVNLLPESSINLDVQDDEGKLVLTPKLWDSYFKPPSGNEKDEFTTLVNKIHSAIGMDTSLLTSENFDGQLEHSVDGVKEDGLALIRIGQEIVARCDEVTNKLESHVFID